MTTTTRLLVLGVVRIFQPVHGYEVRRELVTWRAEEWASIKSGSIYNALKTLTNEGFLEVVGTDQVGGRPERTTYQLTQAGLEEFRSLLRAEWWAVRPLIDPLMAAVSFLGFTARDEAIAALENRIVQVHGFARHLEFATNEHAGVDAPHHIREMHDLMNARVLAEVGWAKQLIERLRAGQYATGGDPPWEPGSTPMTGKPTDLVDRNGAADAPAATKPAATKPAATKPAAIKPAATKPAATKPAATKPAATRPAAIKPAATKPAATKPAATKPDMGVHSEARAKNHSGRRRSAATDAGASRRSSSSRTPRARTSPRRSNG
jgi:DNA-binding PadR family transcriptional regulator